MNFRTIDPAIIQPDGPRLRADLTVGLALAFIAGAATSALLIDLLACAGVFA